jgi:hypothetical protein
MQAPRRAFRLFRLLGRLEMPNRAERVNFNGSQTRQVERENVNVVAALGHQRE